MRAKKMSAAVIGRGFIFCVACMCLCAAGAAGTTVTAGPDAGRQAASRQQAAQSSLVTRVHDTGFVQLNAASFDDLTADQKMAAYWLSMAAIAVNPIAYDQNSEYGIREKHLLEAILTHSKGIDRVVLKKITEYTMLFWGSHGNHNSFTSRKFLPDFTSEEFSAAAESGLKERRCHWATGRVGEGTASACKTASSIRISSPC